MGRRSNETIRNLMIKLKQLDIDLFMTDNRESFRTVLPQDKHFVGKQDTKSIEGINSWFKTGSDD